MVINDYIELDLEEHLLEKVSYTQSAQVLLSRSESLLHEPNNDNVQQWRRRGGEAYVQFLPVLLSESCLIPWKSA